MASKGFLFENKNNYKLFEEYSYKLTSIVYGKSEGEKIVLSKILDDFLSLNYSIQWMENNDRAVLVINQCCLLIPPNDTPLVSRACQLFRKLIVDQEVVVEGVTLTSAYAWCLDALKTVPYSQEPLAILQTIQILPKTHEKLPFTFYDILKKFSNDFVIFYAGLRCFENFSENDRLFEIYEDIIQSVRFKNSVEQSKCFIAVVKGLANSINSDITIEQISFILGVAKIFLNYGLSNNKEHVVIKIEKVPPLNFVLPDAAEKSEEGQAKVKGKYTKKLKKKTASSLPDVESEQTTQNRVINNKLLRDSQLTSDSDYSDSDSNVVSAFNTKVRHACFVLLGTLVNKIDSKILCRFLPVFFPSVVACLKDPASKCRCEVLIVLSLVLTRFKTFLNLADTTGRSAFTSFSQNVAELVKNLHESLKTALISEKSYSVTTRILITTADLIRASPYLKLDKDFLEPLMDAVKPFLNHKDVIIRSSALSAYGCVASIACKTAEIDRVILKNNFSFAKCCLQILSDATVNIAVYVEALQVFAAVVKNYFFEVFERWFDDVLSMFRVCRLRSEETVKVYAAKFLEAVAEGSRLFCVASEQKKISKDDISKLWTFLQLQLGALLELNDPALKAIAIDTIAHLGSNGTSMEEHCLLDYLSKSCQVAFITHLSGALHDDSPPPVRASALRALAALVQVPSMADDELFIMDAIDSLVKFHKDPNLNVRCQAAWLLGVLTDVLLAHYGQMTDLMNEDVVKLLESAINLAKDNKQIVANALRGLGNLMKIVTSDFFEKYKDKVILGIATIVDRATTGTYLKARWNACYALGHTLANGYLSGQTEIRAKVFPALLTLVQSYKNFKVRISAAVALASPPSRCCYGDFYLPTWSALLAGLENAENMEDFNEYQHRDQLLDTLCLGLSHMTCLILTDDLSLVADALSGFKESLQTRLRRARERVVPEKCSVIFNAESRIAELRRTATTDEKRCVNLLFHIFSTDDPYTVG